MSNNIIYPIQPFFVINSLEYYKKTSVFPAIAHFYKFTGGADAASCQAVPDGAIDILFHFNPDTPSSRICGTVKAGQISGFESGTTYFGVRLLPGYFDHIGDASARELMKGENALDDVFRDDFLSEQIFEEKDFYKQIQIFEKHFLEKTDYASGNTHELASAIMQEIYKSKGSIRVQDLEDILNYSRRHLSRTFESVTGMDIKTFSGYVRFQSILKKMNDGEISSLSDIALEGNYYDQAHFQKDFKKFAATTPKAYLKMLKEINYQEKLTVL